jgi:hypothetical protein
MGLKKEKLVDSGLSTKLEIPEYFLFIFLIIRKYLLPNQPENYKRILASLNRASTKLGAKKSYLISKILGQISYSNTFTSIKDYTHFLRKKIKNDYTHPKNINIKII